MKAIAVRDLRNFAVQTLRKTGMGDADARTTADVLVTTDLFGVYSHGTNNLLNYIRKMQAGGLDPKAVPAVEAEGPAWAVINGNLAMGMVTACKAMNLAIEKARETGISYVGVKNSCHFGAAGYYANLAAEQGMIGLAMSNADPTMCIPNSRGVSIGNNPFAFAAPLPNGKSVFLDIALSNVAALKIVMARDKGETLPPGWLVDEEGRPTTDPGGFPYHSFLTPMAAHKGYGLAILVEILSAALTGAGMLGEVRSWNMALSEPNNVGHAFLAIDASKMVPQEVFLGEMERMAAQLRNAPKAKGADRIYVPGEIDWDKRDAAEKTGRISVTDSMVKNLGTLAGMTNTSLKWLDE